MSGDRIPTEALEEQLRSSAAYWDTGGREGAPLVAPGADLTELNLRERKLGHAQLQGADLRGAVLDHAILFRAELDGANLAGAHLFSANGSRASLVEADMRRIEASRSRWHEARFTGASLCQALLTDADMRHAEFVNADLTDASLRNAQLAGASMGTARLAGADITGADLSGTVISSESVSLARGADQIHGEPLLLESTRSHSDPRTAALEFEVEVARQLRDANVGEIHSLEAEQDQPDLVVVTPNRDFIAVEAKTALVPRAFALAELRADVIVVPAQQEFPRTAVAVMSLAELIPWLREMGQEGSEPKTQARGGIALAVRQLARLRPWQLFARRQLEDPSFISRMSVWVDTETSLMLTGADRPLSKLVPSHVDGNGFARGTDWAVNRLGDLDDYEKQVRASWKRPNAEPWSNRRLATRGLGFERELHEHVPGSV